MSEIDDLEKDMQSLFENFQARPEMVTVGASFGVVNVRRDSLSLVEFDGEDNPYESRELTPDEAAQFKAEFPSLFK